MAEKSIPILHGLSARLLLMTLGLVILVALAYFVPALSGFRLDYLRERLAAAETAALALEEVPEHAVSRDLEEEMLMAGGIRAVIVIRRDSRELLLRAGMPENLVDRFSLRRATSLNSIGDAFDALARGGKGFVQVAGPSGSPRFRSIQFVMDEAPLYGAMIDFSVDLLVFSLAMGLLTGGLVYLALHLLVVRPMDRIGRNLTDFRTRPEDSATILVPSGRGDEIGRLEKELARMQDEIRQALAQKSRLANLGLAVSKISHDLRNMLATSQLWTERLQASGDAASAPFAQRLAESFGRAIDLCERTLKYGRADEPPPDKTWIPLRPLVDEVGASLGADDAGKRWVNRISADLRVFADRDQMFRVLSNLGRNALEAMPDGGTVTLDVRKGGEGTYQILVMDHGAGLPEKVRENLFEPFVGGSKGGTGLGLAIARELIEAHGGTLELETTGKSGTVFRICIAGDSDA